MRLPCARLLGFRRGCGFCCFNKKEKKRAGFARVPCARLLGFRCGCGSKRQKRDQDALCSKHKHVARVPCARLLGFRCGCGSKRQKRDQDALCSKHKHVARVPGARRADRAPAGRNVPCPILNLGFCVAASILLFPAQVRPICHVQKVSAAIAVLHKKNQRMTKIAIYAFIYSQNTVL